MTTNPADSLYPIYREHAADGHPGDLRDWYGAPDAIHVRTGRSARVHAVAGGAAHRALIPACGATIGARARRTASTAPVNCPDCAAL